MPLNGDHGSHNSPLRDMSRDVADGSPQNGANSTSTNGINGEGASGGRTSRPKHLNPSRTSMTELKRRAIAIQSFITRTMDERGVHNTSTTASGSGEGNTPTSTNGHAPPAAGASALIDGASAQLEKDSENAKGRDGQDEKKKKDASAEQVASTPSSNGKQTQRASSVAEMSPQDLKTLSVEALLERMKSQLTNFEQIIMK